MIDRYKDKLILETVIPSIYDKIEPYLTDQLIDEIMQALCEMENAQKQSEEKKISWKQKILSLFKKTNDAQRKRENSSC